jgi:hypothetical protein
MLQGQHFEIGEEFFAPILDLPCIIENVTSESAFVEWMERSAKCISTNGEYVGGDE